MSGERITAANLACLLALLALAALWPGAGQAAAAQACGNAWSGDLELAGATWRVGVTRDPDGGAVVDVPSMWRAGHRVPRAFRADTAAFELPYGLGRLDGRVVNCRLEARVVRSDGARAQVSWRARPRLGTRREEELRFDVNGVSVAATLIHPAGVVRAPLVIVVHGGGDSSRADSPPYVFWGDELSRLGYAVLLYDKRGNGGSTGDWNKVGFDERAADVAAMADQLAARPDIDAARIGLLSVSQGGWVAVRAGQMSKRIAFVAAISAPVVTPSEADTYASWIGSLRGGLTVAEADERLALWRAYADYARSGGADESWTTLRNAVEAARARPWFKRRPFDPQDRGDPFFGWYRRVADFDPRPALAELTIPMLWVYGADDTQSDVGRNVAILSGLRDRAAKPYDIAVLAGGDHGIGVAAAPLRGDGTYFTAAPGFLDTVERWFLARRSPQER